MSLVRQTVVLFTSRANKHACLHRHTHTKPYVKRRPNTNIYIYIDPVNVRETELKKREETLLRKEAELNKPEFEIQKGISHVATLKSFVSQLEKKVEAIQEENCLLRVQIHDLTQTTAGEDQSMAADTEAAIIPQLMVSVASLTSCVSSINLRLDKIEATLQGEQPRKKSESGQYTTYVIY